ncbi:MAG: hypothetical protein MSA51_07610 [Fusicatenibacter saccharivorans]|nr:hypothetical protein [Fusicatenibacter saccharivorans]
MYLCGWYHRESDETWLADDLSQKRTDADGFMREKPGDWIFIDWAPMDKTGALCGEQILYRKALECYHKICEVIGKQNDGCAEKAEYLRVAIFEKFYDKEKKVFIDSYECGKRNVTRHSNILAYLFLECSEEQKKDIYERVILNEKVAQITTPYFKFYENQVHCQAGNGKLLEESIRNYYGSMLESGATTLYEEYNPEQKGTEHYAMHGVPARFTCWEIIGLGYRIQVLHTILLMSARCGEI